MNKFVRAIKDLDLAALREMIEKRPAWLDWSEPDGKNALHYVCGVNVLNAPEKAETAFEIFKFFVKNGISPRKLAEKMKRRKVLKLFENA